jgi:glycosyltransferase involved in cell wall biosynthesis
MFHGLINYLPGQGIDVTGLVTGSNSLDAPNIHSFASTSAALPVRLYHLYHSLRAHFQKSTPQLIASHFSPYSLPIPVTSHDVPFVFHFHGPWALESKEEGEAAPSVWLKHRVEQFVYRSADRFIVLSEAFKTLLVERFGVSPGDVDIVPGGVETSRFTSSGTKAQARRRLGWPRDRPIILSVRRLVRRVGLENLIQAMEYVVQHFPDACLFIAGKGPLASELEAHIDALNLAENVKLLGFVPDEDLPTAYRAADFSVVPTRSLEGFGLVAVESLAAGTPVLATPVGGLPEVVRELSSDLVMNGSSTEDIQDHLVWALNGSLNLPIPEACRDFAVSRYDWPVVARQVRSVYEEVL